MQENWTIRLLSNNIGLWHEINKKPLLSNAIKQKIKEVARCLLNYTSSVSPTRLGSEASSVVSGSSTDGGKTLTTDCSASLNTVISLSTLISETVNASPISNSPASTVNSVGIFVGRVSISNSFKVWETMPRLTF